MPSGKNRLMSLVRIDPRHGPLWRDARTMQFGLDGTLSLRDPAPWQERAIAQLEHGFPSAGAEQLAVDPSPLARSADGPTSAVGELLRLLAPVLETIVPDEHGVVVRAADAVSPVVATAVIDALTDDGWPAAWLAPDEEPVDPATPVVLLAAHVVPPHLGARCARDDAPHLPLVFTASGAEVGPLVLPGRSACLACLDSHRTAADSAWPVLASQLLLRSAPAVPLSLAVGAASLTARLLYDGLVAEQAETAADEPLATRSAMIERAPADPTAPEWAPSRRWLTHRPHPECLCRSAERAAVAAQVHAA